MHGRETVDAQHAPTSLGEPVRRGAAHPAEADDDDVVVAHAALLIRSIPGSNNGSRATTAGIRSPKYSISSGLPGRVNSTGSQAYAMFLPTV